MEEIVFKVVVSSTLSIIFFLKKLKICKNLFKKKKKWKLNKINNDNQITLNFFFTFD